MRGFTLLETVIAMVIMASALLLLTSSWSGAFMRVRKTQNSFEIASIMERKMTDLELEYRGKSIDEIPAEKEGDFGSEYPQYTWGLKSKKLEFPDLSSSLSAREGGADQMLLMVIKQLSEIIGKSVKEVTLTINFKPKGTTKPQVFTVTTYYVDFDKQVSLGFPGQ